MTPRQRRILRKAIKLARAGQTQYALDRHVNVRTMRHAWGISPRRVRVSLDRACRSWEFWNMPIRLSQVEPS